MRAEDAAIIVGFHENTDETFFLQWGGGRFYTYPLTRRQLLKRMRNTKNTRFFAATLDDAVIGMAELDFIDWDKKECAVCRFLLGEAYRNRGFGGEVLRLLCAHAFNELGMKKVKLTVFNFNTNAYRCYIKAGFRVVSEEIRPNGWKAIKMELEGDSHG